MKRLTHPLFIPGLILFLILFIILDSYLLPTSELVEKKSRAYIERTNSSVTRSHETYFFVSETNHHYKVPENVFGKVSEGEPFSIRQSFLLNKPLKISWCKDDHCYIQPMGTMNTTHLSTILFGLLSLFALICILLYFSKADNKISSHWKFVAFGLTLGLFLFYLFFK